MGEVARAPIALDARAAAPGAAAPPRRTLTERLRDYFLRTAALPATLATTLVAVLASLLLTSALLLAMVPKIDVLFWAGLGISVLIPMLVAPPVAYTTTRLLQELAATRRTVETLAVTDALTGTFNRRHFLDVGEREFDRARRAAMPLALLVLDLDDFKQVNDTHGHLVGDAVLQAVGRACLTSVRPYDIVARYGGEEFVVLLPATSADGAAALAERLRASIAALQVSAGKHSVTPTASIGVASLGDATATLEALFARADAAMYAAKRVGKNCVHCA